VRKTPSPQMRVKDFPTFDLTHVGKRGKKRGKYPPEPDEGGQRCPWSGKGDLTPFLIVQARRKGRTARSLEGGE